MSRRLPSASSLDMALACQGPGILPTAEEEAGEYAAGGLVMHEYLDKARKVGKEAALAEAPEEEREWLETLDLEALPQGAESEVALGWDHRTDKAVRYTLNGHRSYPEDGLFHGTSDLVGVFNGRVFIGDYKRYGAKVRAKDSAQLAFYALAACRLAGVDEAEVMMLAPTPKGWRIDRAMLDGFDLDNWASRFRELAVRLETHTVGVLPVLKVGGHCQYCRSLRYCPAQSAMVRAVSSMEIKTIDERVAELSDDEAGSLYERVLLVEKVAEAAKKALQLRAKQAPIPLPGGKVLKEVRWTQTVKSDIAKEELALLTKDLEQRGEISKQPASQVRAVLSKD